MNKKIIILSMCVAILIMTIGYSAFISNIKINGTANITSTWNILFTNIKETSKTDGVIVKEEPKASGTLATFNVAFTKPGDKIIYEITVENKGSLNAVINKINATELGSDAIKFEISGIKEGDKLSHGTSTTFNVTISYNGEIVDDPNLKDNELQIDITYIQDLKEQEQKEPDIVPTRLSQKILYDNVEQSDKNIDFSQISSDTNGKGLYYTNTNTQDNRVTYYFRGDVKNNYVSFAGFYWRIVRINEDGSIRLIYQGTKPTDTGENATIGQSAFNSMIGDNAFVGYMYGKPITYKDGYYNFDSGVFAATGTVKLGKGYTFDTETGIYTLTDVVDGYYSDEFRNYYVCANQGTTCNSRMIKINRTNKSGNNYQLLEGESHGGYFSTSYDQAHKNEVNSDIKTKLEDWYGKNLINFDSYLADTGFCNDRSLANGYEGKGYGNEDTYYGAYERLQTNKNPQFSCPNAKNDLFTVKNNKGNKASKYKIGLITADEVAYAGGLYKVSNNSYYLYTMAGCPYWTMSPLGFYDYSGYFEAVDYTSINALNDTTVFFAPYIKPVINLKADIEITDVTQDGTINSPYIVKTTN